MRLGPVAAATWAAITTATSNGSVNSMHDSLNPIAGVVPMSLMMLNVVFSGIGAGFENMLMYIIVAVFIAGLMVGRTPEYLGKKVEAKEVKLAMMAILIHPLLICCGAGLFAATDCGAKATVANPGSHGFSEILYEFTSAAANNGSGFEGLADNNPPWNIATGIVLLLGRFPALILPLAVAGFLSREEARARDDRHAADRQPDVRRDAAGDGAPGRRPVVHAGRRPRPDRRPPGRPPSPTVTVEAAAGLSRPRPRRARERRASRSRSDRPWPRRPANRRDRSHDTCQYLEEMNPMSLETEVECAHAGRLRRPGLQAPAPRARGSSACSSRPWSAWRPGSRSSCSTRGTWSATRSCSWSRSAPS